MTRRFLASSAIAGVLAVGAAAAQAPAGGQPLPDAVTQAVHAALTEQLMGAAAQVQGPAVDPSGAPIGDTVKMGLMLVKEVTIEQFQQAQQQLQALKNAPPAVQDAELRKLQDLSNEASDAYKQMFDLDHDMQGDLHGEFKGTYESEIQDAEYLDNKGQHAEAEAVRQRASETVWGQYLRARQRFYDALGKHPLLGVRLPGGFTNLFMDQPYFFAQLKQAKQDGTTATGLRTLLSDHIDQAVKNLHEQEVRIRGMNTWSDLFELANPAFAATQKQATGVGGDLGKGLVDAVTGTAKGANAVKAYDSALSSTAISIVQVGSMLIPVAGPLISAGITTIQVYKSGGDYVVALGDVKNAEHGATVTGYQTVIAANDKASQAGKQLLVNVAMAPADLPGFVSAAKAGKLIVKKGATALHEAATVIAAGRTTTEAVAAGEALSGTEAAARTTTGAGGVVERAERGVQKAHDLGLPPSEIQKVNTYIERTRSAAATGKGGMLTDAATKQLVQLDDLDGLINEARAAGVPEADIQNMLARAKKTATLEAYTETLAHDLFTATVNKKGQILIVDRSAAQKFADRWITDTARPANVIVTDAVTLETIGTNLAFMKNGRTVTWTPEQLNFLRNLMAGRGGNPLKMFRYVSDEQVFIPLFTQEDLDVAKQFLDAPNFVDIARGNAPLTGTTGVPVPAAPAPVDPNAFNFGALTPGGVGTLSDEELSKALKTLRDNPNFPVDPSLVNAIMDEATKRTTATIFKTAVDVTSGANTINGVAKGTGGLTKDDEKRAAAAMADDGPAPAVAPTPPAPATAPARTPTGTATTPSVAAPPAPKPAGLTPDDEKAAAAAIADDEPTSVTPPPLAPASPDQPPAGGGTTGGGRISINPDGTLKFTPPGMTTGYPGAFGADGGFIIYPPGTTLLPPPDGPPLPPPIAVTPPSALPTGGLTIGPDGTVIYTGVPFSGFPGPNGPGPVLPLPGALIFHPPDAPPKGTTGATGGGGGPTTGGVTFGPPQSNFLGEEKGMGWGESGNFEPAPSPPFSPPGGITDGFDLGGLIDDHPGACCFPGVQPLIFDLGVTVTVSPAPGDDADRGPAWPWRLHDVASAVRALLAGGRSVASARALRLANLPIRLPSAQPPRASGGQTSGAPAGALRTIIRSLGTSQGDAFDLQILNEGRSPLNVSGSGVVVEPLKREAQQELEKQLGKLTAHAGGVTRRVEAYCLAYGLRPPTPGMLFQIATPDIQQKFAPARTVLRAGQKLAAAGLLTPDSNPKSYVESIKQYAIWTKLEHWDVKKFTEVWIEKTKANAAALKRNWTGAMENALVGAAPGRWKDIQLILDEAERRP